MGAEAKRDSEADEVVHPPARLTLFGFAPTPATVSLVARTTSWRMARTARALGLTALVAPLAFLVPPHAPGVRLRSAVACTSHCEAGRSASHSGRGLAPAPAAKHPSI